MKNWLPFDILYVLYTFQFWRNLWNIFLLRFDLDAQKRGQNMNTWRDEENFLLRIMRLVKKDLFIYLLSRLDEQENRWNEAKKIYMKNNNKWIRKRPSNAIFVSIERKKNAKQDEWIKTLLSNIMRQNAGMFYCIWGGNLTASEQHRHVGCENRSDFVWLPIYPFY